MHITRSIAAVTLIASLAILAAALAPPPARASGYLFANTWGSRGTTPGSFLLPKGIAVDSQGRVYVADYLADRIDVYALDGTLLDSWGTHGSAPGELDAPSRLAVGPDDSIYVTDAYNFRVQRFAPDGTLLALWGSYGTGPGQFLCPRGVAVGPDGLVYVSDGLLGRVEVFTSGGRFVREWGRKGTGPGELMVAKDVAVAPNGHVYVVDSHLSRVQMYTARGRYLKTIGTRGPTFGHFDGPRGACATADGRLFVAEANTSRVQEFTLDGAFVRAWGCRGSLPGEFFGPRDVALAPDGSLVVVDTHNQRVERFVAAPSGDATSPLTRLSLDHPLAGGWSRSPVTVTFIATDPDDAVAVTYLQRSGPKSPFRPVSAPVTFSQGIHSLHFLSIDTAANQEATRRRTVSVDWTAPAVRPRPLPAIVTGRGRTVSLALTVADNLSPDCRFTAKVVMGSAGQSLQVVQKIAFGMRPVSRNGRSVALAWTCTAGPGTYHLQVRITDAAGNVTLTSGSLRVQ